MIMHNAHAHVVGHAHFQHLTMTIPRQKIMVLSSEIIVIVARSFDSLCICCIFWIRPGKLRS